MQSFAQIGYGIASLCFLAFALQLAPRARAQRAKLLFAALVASSIWAASAGLAAWVASDALWLATQLFDSIRLSAWIVFVTSLIPHASERRLPALLPVNAAPGLALFATSIYSYQNGIATAGSSISTIIFGLSVLGAVFGLMRCEELFRVSPEERRWAVKPLCIGLAGFFGFDLFMFTDAMILRQMSAEVWAVRGVFHALMIPLIMLSTARNRHWTIDVGLSRNVVVGSVTLLLCGAYLLAVAGAGYYVRLMGGDWGRAIQVTVLCSALVLFGIALTSGTIRSRIRVFVHKNFFSYQYDYREEWLRFTASLASKSGDITLSQRVIKALADLVESPGGGLWLAADSGEYKPAGRLNIKEITEIEPANSAMIKFLTHQGWIIDLHEHASHPQRHEELDVSAWLKENEHAWLIIPLATSATLVGFVVLAPARASIEVNWEVRDLLKTAARQAATFLALTKAAEALAEARQFDAFNRMSAFVVHDLKNLVSQLSLMIKNAERHAANPEFQRDMLGTVEHVVERMNGLLLQLRSGTAPIEKARQIDLIPIIERVLAAHRNPPRDIVLELQPALRTVGHEDRLERVMGHLLQNAIDATNADSRILVKAFREQRFAVVAVEDNGAGMTEVFVREHLFKPFRSTKTKGMGIGAYESHEYIKELGGHMTVHSELGRGTRISIYLPSHDISEVAIV